MVSLIYLFQLFISGIIWRQPHRPPLKHLHNVIGPILVKSILLYWSPIILEPNSPHCCSISCPSLRRRPASPGDRPWCQSSSVSQWACPGDGSLEKDINNLTLSIPGRNHPFRISSPGGRRSTLGPRTSGWYTSCPQCSRCAWNNLPWSWKVV